MSYVVGRLKRKSVEVRKITECDDEIIPTPNFDHSVPFDPHYRPEDYQWLRIEDFSKSPYAIASLGAAVNTADFMQLKQDDALNLKFICVIQGDYRFYQRIAPSQIIKKPFLKLSGLSVVSDEKIIIINDKPHAAHDTSTDKLYFSDFSILKTFFSGIEELYKEATKEEVAEFLNNEVMSCTADFSGEMVSKPNRHRISLAKAKLGSYTKQNVEQLIQEFPDYIKDVEIKDGCFVIKSDHDLRLAIFCIEERYYTTPVSKEKRLANSVLKLM